MPTLRHLSLPLALLCGCASHPRFDGPLPVRNQHPAQLTVLQLEPAGAAPLACGTFRLRADATYSSLFLGESGGGDEFLMDGELLRVGFATRAGLGGGFELRTEIAVAHTTGGFLDDFISSWHETFGLPDHNRAQAPENRFEVRAAQAGTQVYAMEEDDLALLDLPIELCWTFLPVTAERPFGLAVRGGVELPTGDADRGFGNGEVDWAIGLAAEGRAGIVSLTGQASYTFAGTPDMAASSGFSFRDVTALGLGAEVAVADPLAFVLQTQWETSTLRAIDLDSAADPQWLIWGGLRGRLGPRVLLDVGVGEDLAGFVSPDVSFYIGLSVDIGATPR